MKKVTEIYIDKEYLDHFKCIYMYDSRVNLVTKFAQIMSGMIMFNTVDESGYSLRYCNGSVVKEPIDQDKYVEITGCYVILARSGVLVFSINKYSSEYIRSLRMAYVNSTMFNFFIIHNDGKIESLTADSSNDIDFDVIGMINDINKGIATRSNFNAIVKNNDLKNCKNALIKAFEEEDYIKVNDLHKSLIEMVGEVEANKFVKEIKR